MKRLNRLVAPVVCCFLFVNAISAKSNDVTEINVALKTTGDKMRGPRTILLTHVNVLRYDVGVNKTATYTPGLSIGDLGLPFIPPIPSSDAETASAGATPAAAGDRAESARVASDLTTRFNAIVGKLNSYEGERVTKIQTPIERAIDTVNAVQDETEQFIRDSDGKLVREKGPESIIQGIPAVVSRIDEAQLERWPDTNKLHTALAQLRTELRILRTTVPAPIWNAWIAANQSAYDHVDARITQLQELIEAVDHNSESAVTFRRHQQWLTSWENQLKSIQSEGAGAFTLPAFKVGCGFSFGDKKETKVELSLRDRLAGRDAEAKPQEIITVECSSPISLSGGFGFSSIEERDFRFVQSTKTVEDEMGQESQMVINTFGFENRSSFRMLPVLLLNTRFWENDTIGLHLSAGAAVDVKTGETGTDVEFIVGPSFSIWRTLFVTGGLHVGRVPELVGGFDIGEEVPSGIDAPPLEKTWKKGFAFTVSYRIK